AVYTRFPYVFFLVWMVIFFLVRNRRPGVALVVASVAVCGLVLVALQYKSSGWFWMYTIAIYQDHTVDRAKLVAGFKSFLAFAPYVVCLPIAVAALAFARRLSARTVLWFGMLVCAIPAALLPLAKVGGFANDLLPLAFLPGVATLVV